MNETLGFNPELIQTAEQERKPRWQERLEKIRANRERNLEIILSDILGPKGQIIREEKSPEESEIEQVRRSMAITVNIGYEGLKNLLSEGRLKSREEKSPRWKQIFDEYLRMRKNIEKKLDIRPTCTPEDPPLIYGAVISENEEDQIRGGAPDYGNVILILKTESISDRATFSYGDSFGSGAVATVEDAPLLKYWRDRRGRDYIEAQIAGGVSLADIREIRVAIDPENTSAVRQYEEVLNSPETEQIRNKYPELRITRSEIKEQ